MNRKNEIILGAVNLSPYPYRSERVKKTLHLHFDNFPAPILSEIRGLMSRPCSIYIFLIKEPKHRYFGMVYLGKPQKQERGELIISILNYVVFHFRLDEVIRQKELL